MVKKIKSIKGFYLGVSLLLAAVVAIFNWLPRPVKTVGHWKIYQEDTQWRDAIVQSFFPDAKPGAGLKQLEKSALHLKVLENNGVTLTRQEILAEAKRIERNSRNTEHLAKIKNLFAGNEEAYLKNYVLPTLVDRVIAYEFFPNNAEIHKKSLIKAQDLIDKSKAGAKPFIEVAQSLNVPVREVSLSLQEGLVWDEEKKNSKGKKRPIIDHSPKKNLEVYNRVKEKLRPRQRQRREAQSWISEIVNNLKPGEVMDKPINQEGCWLVVQYLGSNDKQKFKLAVAEIVKLEYGAWLAQELEKIEK